MTSLYKIIGRKAGSLQNYGYSSAMKGADFVWDEASLDQFIANPEQIVPGNNMRRSWRRIGSGFLAGIAAQRRTGVRYSFPCSAANPSDGRGCEIASRRSQGNVPA